MIPWFVLGFTIYAQLPIPVIISCSEFTDETVYHYYYLLTLMYLHYCQQEKSDAEAAALKMLINRDAEKSRDHEKFQTEDKKDSAPQQSDDSDDDDITASTSAPPSGELSLSLFLYLTQLVGSFH